MEKLKFLCLFTAVLFAFAGCSKDDDDVFANVPNNLDSSLLPGYWLMVTDSGISKNGLWISEEEDTSFGDGGKKVTDFLLQDSAYVPATLWGNYTWKVLENGVICINKYREGGMAVISLTNDILVMKPFRYIDGKLVANDKTNKWKRSSYPIEIEYSYDTNYGPYYGGYNYDNARREYVSLESLPQWLRAWIASEEERTNRRGVIFRKGYNDPKLFRGEWNDTVYYYIYIKEDGCLLCDSYYEDGTPLDFENEQVRQAFENSIPQMKRIIVN